MSDLPSDPAEAETQQGSVFGNLPDSRPGGRSPLRDPAAKPRRSAAKASAKPRAAAKPKAAARAATKPKPAGERKPASRRPEPAATEAEAAGGLEDIAWAGVAVAAEAATAGVRLLSKTIEALRGNSERT